MSKASPSYADNRGFVDVAHFSLLKRLTLLNLDGKFKAENAVANKIFYYCVVFYYSTWSSKGASNPLGYLRGTSPVDRLLKLLTNGA